MKKIMLCCLCISLIWVGLHAQSAGEILTFPANPRQGFDWEYALYLPRTIDKSKKMPVLLIMTNTGRSNTVEETKEITLERLRYETSEYPIADKLAVPLVMPIVPRLDEFYTHDLSRAVFTYPKEPFKRLDLQVLNMLQDARKQLKKRGIHTKKEFLVTGFSASGVFAWRWTMLHPEYVLATATGGALYPMLPIEEWNGKQLIYPVGVGDMEKYTGKKFNKKAWSKIPIFSTNGEKDDNDTFPYEECFAKDVERPVLQYVLPGKDIFERRAQSLQLLATLAPNVQTYIYPRLRHDPVTKDVIAFFQQHIQGGPLQPIEPTDTSSEKPQEELPMPIEQVLWGDDPQIPAIYRKSLPADMLVLWIASPTQVNWQDNEYGDIDILCRKEVVARPRILGSISDDEKTLLLFDLNLSAEEMEGLRNTKCNLHLRAHHPEVLAISSKITFRMK